MIESYLLEGRQDISDHMTPGCSITDPCLGWEDTERLIYDIAEKCWYQTNSNSKLNNHLHFAKLKEGAAKSSNTTDEATPSTFKFNSFLFFFLSDFKLIQCFFQFFKIATCFFQKIKIMWFYIIPLIKNLFRFFLNSFPVFS